MVIVRAFKKFHKFVVDFNYYLACGCTKDEYYESLFNELKYYKNKRDKEAFVKRQKQRKMRKYMRSLKTRI